MKVIDAEHKEKVKMVKEVAAVQSLRRNLFARELNIVALTGYALLKTQTLCLIKHAMAMETIFTVLEKAKKSAAEVRDLKLNIANTPRRKRDNLINGVFNRRAVRSNINHQRSIERIRSD